jgi:hypothetical protein
MKKILAVVAFLLFCSATSAQNVEDRRRSLKGIVGFYVSIDNLDSAVEKEGLTTNQIRSDIELRLKTAGIQVLTKEQASQIPGKPQLRIDLMIAGKQGLYPYALDIASHQMVRLDRDPSIIVDATTWSIGSAGISDLAGIRDMVRENMDEFIKAWQTVNPK